MTAARWPTGVSLDLSTAAADALDQARYRDGVRGAERLRALVWLWEADPILAETVTARARDLARAAPRRR